MIDLRRFIREHVTGRTESFFQCDIDRYTFRLNERIRGSSILVIGGAGTIGSSFIKALLPFNPDQIIVVDHSENQLTELVRDLRSSADFKVPDNFTTYPLDFSHPIFYKILRKKGPFDVIANFAAHKHVRSEKDHYSIETMLGNNVLQAQRLLETLAKNPPGRFFCVSTDKAANPVNVMGASKKLMEDVILTYASDIHITTARFANVAFSNGSLLDGYLKRLLNRQPLSCPSDVRRYFVSPEESGQICMLACMLGESGDIFYPQLESTGMKYFKDITYSFLNEMGLEAHHCVSEEDAKLFASNLEADFVKYPVYFFSSDTSGEKLFEEFYTEFDDLHMDRFESLGVIKNNSVLNKKILRQSLEDLTNLISSEDYSKKDLIDILTKLVPSFNHFETGKSLDQKM